MLTFLPIIVDPSHATGVSAMVEPASRAALEMGSHGLLIEIADFSLGEPKCDGLQAIDATTLARIVEFAHRSGVRRQEPGVRSEESDDGSPKEERPTSGISKVVVGASSNQNA
jgi:hypothetical protein